MAVVSRPPGTVSLCQNLFLENVRRAVRYVERNGSRENGCRHPAAMLSAVAVQQLNRVSQHRSSPTRIEDDLAM